MYWIILFNSEIAEAPESGNHVDSQMSPEAQLIRIELDSSLSSPFLSIHASESPTKKSESRREWKEELPKSKNTQKLELEEDMNSLVQSIDVSPPITV